MATSGSINFNVDRDDIVQQALELLNIIGAGETPSAEDSKLARNRLNGMVKAWQAQGLHLWSTEEATLFLADEIGEYDLSSAAASARATKTSDAVVTQLDADAGLLATSLTVNDTTGMTAADIVGIVLDSDVVHWTTIVSVDSSTTLTITTGLVSAAADNNNVYAFTTRINRPLRILSVRHVSGFEATLREIPMTALAKQDYYNIPAKNTVSTPNSFYYDPQLTTGQFKIWPTPSDPQTYIRFTYERSLEDFDASADEPDFPQEWIDAIIYSLAARIGPAYGRATDPNYQVILQMAEVFKNEALQWDREVVDMTWTLDC